MMRFGQFYEPGATHSEEFLGLAVAALDAAAR